MRYLTMTKLSTITGQRETTTERTATKGIVFEATVPERSHVRVSVDEQGKMSVTHAEWVLVGDTEQWVIQNAITS